MKSISKIFMFATVLLCSNILMRAQARSTAVPFLILAPDSRSGGLGESGAGIADNGAAIYWNPAGLAFQTGTEVSVTHSNWLPQFNLDMFYDYLTFKKYMPELDGTISSSITYMNFGEFARTNSSSPDIIGYFKSFDAALTVGYATKISRDWGLGGNLRLIHSRLSDKSTESEQGSGVATSVSFDIAAMWRPLELDLPLIGDMGNRLSIGANISNIGPKIYYIDQAQADPIPTNFRLGIAARLFQDDYNSLTYSIDFSKLLVDRSDSTGKRKEFYQAMFTSWADESFGEEMKDIITSMGMEYWYGTPEEFMFALRAGYFYEDPTRGNRQFVTLGAGIRYDIYGFDFSYITTDLFKNGGTHPLSDTLRFTLLIGWGGEPQKIQGFPRGI